MVATALLLGPSVLAGQTAPRAAPEPPEAADAPVESERLYLSGRGPERPRGWEFRIDSGRGARQWRVIPVPSNWELEGYGRYTHGKQWWRPAERAVYRTQFITPRSFADRRVELVFEGVMTDAEVWLNGRPVGRPHRGGFTRFAYDVSTLLRFRLPNLLEVRVAEASADASVNRAEREADYWTFGGIYRPVYLESHPRSSITRIAVDARHDGRLTVDVAAGGLSRGAEARVQVETLEGQPVGEPLLEQGLFWEGPVRIAGRVEGVVPWSAESPRLYRLRVELVGPEGGVLHRRYVRIGFRTVELRPGEGLFVNGRRVLLKGVNRHSHWPATGRAVPAAVNRRDVELIRSMNMNAVRTAHSPPDPDFLDACDELGLYVLDELPGWHDAYDTEVGARILWEMVERDLNHPSVILWANGNEGGWNTELDPLFETMDPQGRPVIHPGERALGFDASHYPDWQELARMVAAPPDAASPPPVLLPTEMLHALYDGGGGASLDDYWQRLRSSGRLGGAFLWSLFDEGVVRTDRGGWIDTGGNRGADGLLGPYRQPEASHQAIRELWSPVRIAGSRFTPAAVEIELDNRFDHTDLADCTLRWRWLSLPAPRDDSRVTVVAAGERRLPAAAPGDRVAVELERPAAERPAEAIELRVLAPDGRPLTTWVLADERAGDLPPQPNGPADDRQVRVERRGARLVLHAPDGRQARFDLDSGALKEMTDGAHRLSLTGGARRADGRRASLADVEVESRGGLAVVRARYEGVLDALTWTFDADGWLRLEYVLTPGRRDADYLGIGFDYPLEQVRGLSWLGGGPYRVWRNRQAGARLGLWQTAVNDTVTGESWVYPEFPGFYADVRWANLSTREGVLTLAPGPGLYLGIFRSGFPSGARFAVAEMPRGITVLHRISAIGTKFHPPASLGPSARGREAPGPLQGGVELRFTGGEADR